MKQSLRHIRGTFRAPLIGAAGGAVVGALIEIGNDVLPGGLPMASLVDIWPPVLAIVGLLGGAIAASVLRVSGMRRSS